MPVVLFVLVVCVCARFESICGWSEFASIHIQNQREQLSHEAERINALLAYMQPVRIARIS